MSNIYQLPSGEKRYDEASLWIEKLGEGLTAEETEELQRWMAAVPENRKLLLKMAKLWDKMEALARLSSLFPEPAMTKLASPRRAIPIAASVIVALSLGTWVALAFIRADESNAPATRADATLEAVYETALGEQSTVTLADGTELVLNTSSRVWVTYAPHYRSLVLKAGEVHVRVAEDPARPFSVIAGNRIVQAVGTAFNVEITTDHRIELVVTQGTVRVGIRLPAQSHVTMPSIQQSTSQVLVAGEEMILGAPVEAITSVTPAEIEVKLSWRNGNLIFRGESLEEAMAEVGRYTAVEFVIEDEHLREKRIGGLFKAGDVDGLLAVLRENFDIAYEHVDEDTVLLSAL